MGQSKRFSNPYLSLLQTAWRYASGQKRRYLLIYTMFLISSGINALHPLIWGLYINEVQQQTDTLLSLTFKYVGIYMLIRLGDWLFHGFARVWERKLAFEVGQNFLAEMYHKTLSLPVIWHQDNHSGATINRVRKAYEALKNFFGKGFMYLNAISRFAFSFAGILYFAPEFGLIAAIVGAGIIAIIFRFDKPFIRTLKEVNEKEHIVSSTLFDSLSNIITVITLRLEKRMEVGLSKKVWDIFPPLWNNIKINEWKWFTVDMCVGLLYGIIILGYVFMNWTPGEVFLIGGLVTLAGYVDRFTSVFYNIAWQYTEIVQFHTDVSTAENIIHAYDEIEQHRTDPALSSTWQHLSINHLSYLHAEETKEGKIRGLKDLNIDLRKGSKIAFIGESGSGKSTLLSLLRGLYEPKEGLEVRVDGQSQASLGKITKQISLFPQEPEIFESTIEYNICLGLTYEEEVLNDICQAVRFSEVIEQLPQGLQSSIQEKGVNLSGGQKQRLALARGVFAAKDSEIVLLDEPTSSVDPKTENLIYEELFRFFEDKAVVSALHRLHLLPKFDYIYVLEQGQVVDEGTFSHLYQNSAVFQELWKHQEEQSVNTE
ncbi:MAG: ABC transporter ATP-binding protein [Bacteroidota bacterium]